MPSLKSYQNISIFLLLILSFSAYSESKTGKQSKAVLAAQSDYQLKIDSKTFAKDRDQHFQFLAKHISKLLNNPMFRDALLEGFVVKHLLAQKFKAEGDFSKTELNISLRSLFDNYLIARDQVKFNTKKEKQLLQSTKVLSNYVNALNTELLNHMKLSEHLSDILQVKLIVPPATAKKNKKLSKWLNKILSDDYNKLYVSYFSNQEDSGGQNTLFFNTEPGWQQYEVFDIESKSSHHDADKAFGFPLLVVGIDEQKSMVASLVVLNQLLKKHKLAMTVQTVGQLQSPQTVPALNTNDAVSVSRITEILVRRSFHEPYIKGEPEIYAVVVGLCTDDELAWRCRPKLHHDNSPARIKTLPPNNNVIPSDIFSLSAVKRLGKLYAFSDKIHASEPLIIWDEFDYSEVSILFFEHDGLDLARIEKYLEKNASKKLVTFPSKGASSRMAEQFLFMFANQNGRDDDDLLDQFKSIERDSVQQSWKSWGSSSNIKLGLSRDYIAVY